MCPGKPECGRSDAGTGLQQVGTLELRCLGQHRLEQTGRINAEGELPFHSAPRERSTRIPLSAATVRAAASSAVSPIPAGPSDDHEPCRVPLRASASADSIRASLLAPARAVADPHWPRLTGGCWAPPVPNCSTELCHVGTYNDGREVGNPGFAGQFSSARCGLSAAGVDFPNRDRAGVGDQKLSYRRGCEQVRRLLLRLPQQHQQRLRSLAVGQAERATEPWLLAKRGNELVLNEPLQNLEPRRLQPESGSPARTSP